MSTNEAGPQPVDQTVAASLGTALINHVRAIVAADDEYERELAQRKAEVVAEGKRLVSGGQNGSDWSVEDAQTHEVLATGPTLDEWDAAWEQHPDWVNVDFLADFADDWESTPVPEVLVGLWRDDIESEDARAWLRQMEARS